MSGGLAGQTRSIACCRARTIARYLRMFSAPAPLRKWTTPRSTTTRSQSWPTTFRRSDMKSKLQRLLDRIMEIVGEMGGAPAAAMVAFLVAAAAHAAPFASIPQNELRLGSNQTTGTKTLTMGQFGRGLRFNSSNDSLDLVSHILHIGG